MSSAASSHHSTHAIELITPLTGQHLDDARALLLDYQSDIQVDLGFQSFERELADLPGAYQAPHGALLLVYVDGSAAGCCALRPLPDSDYRNACEMKRLFVRRAFRGLGLGRQLLDHILLLAEQAGYDTLLLDTFVDMEAARAMYHDVGFVEVPPYYHNPLPGAHYLMLEL